LDFGLGILALGFWPWDFGLGILALDLSRFCAKSNARQLKIVREIKIKLHELFVYLPHYKLF
jgi:hypothetical protein